MGILDYSQCPEHHIVFKNEEGCPKCNLEAEKAKNQALTKALSKALDIAENLTGALPRQAIPVPIDCGFDCENGTGISCTYDLGHSATTHSCGCCNR